jgi:glycosyltransferase involved in cell wall biosynthesis
MRVTTEAAPPARPRVTFGIIVLNGEPFTRYCLRALYPFAHEIIVVEGGHEDTRAVTTADGHSTDGTLDVLRQFKREEDPLDKVRIVTREGFWPKTDEFGNHRTPQSRAYAERATGDYLWQVDIDEFYLPQDMDAVLRLLAADPGVTAVSFNVLPFWGGLGYISDGWRWRRGGLQFHRLFKWGPGYRYVTHEPPTVHDERGRDLRSLRWIRGEETQRRGIRLYHYDHLFPKQVLDKAAIYRFEKPSVCAEIQEWAENDYLHLRHPYHVERHYWHPSWLERFSGVHPPEAVRMMDDIRTGRLSVELRRIDDVERLLASRCYRLGCAGLKVLEPLDRARLWAGRQTVRAGHAPRKLDQYLGARVSKASSRGPTTPGDAPAKGGRR